MKFPGGDMKLVSMFIVLCAFSLEVRADEGANFATHKSEMLANIEERIAKLQEHKSCVSSANDKEAMKACREKMKDWRDGERSEMQEKRKERMEKRLKKMEEKKQAKEAKE